MPIVRFDNIDYQVHSFVDIKNPYENEKKESLINSKKVVGSNLDKYLVEAITCYLDETYTEKPNTENFHVLLASLSKIESILFEKNSEFFLSKDIEKICLLVFKLPRFPKTNQPVYNFLVKGLFACFKSTIYSAITSMKVPRIPQIISEIKTFN